MFNKPICLVGFICSGKSTIGQLLSGKLSCDFFDTDRLIEHKFQKPISEVFQSLPEEEFRNLEYETLSEIFIQKKQPFVLATGGGIFEKNECRDLLFQKTTSFYLKNSLENIRLRISNRSHAAFWSELCTERRFNQRIIQYEKAHYIVETENKSPDEIINRILLFRIPW
ncbi:MAG: shikimate kinase [Deltaproteobacteria bacterium]|nr:shikimate kinase [Deltaproteobacteria bacterium]